MVSDISFMTSSLTSTTLNEDKSATSSTLLRPLPVKYKVSILGPLVETSASRAHCKPSATNWPAAFLSFTPLEPIRALTRATCGELRLSIIIGT